MKITTIITFALSSVGILLDHVSAHGISERAMHPREIARRQLEANRRHVVARNCASQIAKYHRARKLARRGMAWKRQEETSIGLPETSGALEPHTPEITNLTCVTAPEVTEGPYYLNNALLRQDIREDQQGILLSLDIGVIDTSTCEPLPAALVEIWHCNATGSYSGFTTAGGTGGGGGPGGPSGSISMELPSGTDVGAAPSGAPGGGGGGGGGMSSGKTDEFDFLRGGWETNENGIVTFNTIYPGFYTGRTIHIHTMVHQNVTYNNNGTFVSRSGSLVHIGQMFFDEALNDQVVALEPYTSTTQTRQLNDADSILAEENANGYNAFVDTELIGSDISEGVLGYITLTVDSTAEYSVTSFNYYEGEDDLVSGTASGTRTGTAEDSESTSDSGSSDAGSSFASLWWIRGLARMI